MLLKEYNKASIIEIEYISHCHKKLTIFTKTLKTLMPIGDKVGVSIKAI